MYSAEGLDDRGAAGVVGGCTKVLLTGLTPGDCTSVFASGVSSRSTSPVPRLCPSFARTVIRSGGKWMLRRTFLNCGFGCLSSVWSPSPVNVFGCVCRSKSALCDGVRRRGEISSGSEFGEVVDGGFAWVVGVTIASAWAPLGLPVFS